MKINVNKEFIGWTKSNLDNKSKILCKFIRKHREYLGHSELDDICSRMFDLFEYYEDE